MQAALQFLSSTVVVLMTIAVPVAGSAQSKPPGDLTVTVEARAVQPGEVLVFTLHPRREISEAHVRVFDRDTPAFRVDARTWRALVGIDLETKPHSYSAIVTTYKD